MVFNLSQDIYLTTLIIIFVWLSFLSFFLYRALRHYNHLTRGIVKEDLKTILEKILQNTDLSQEKIEKLIERCQKIEEEGRYHIKKIGILRFNPFKDTGGNQSFILALLDDKDNGLILSSLFTRAGNRWYLKKIEKSRGIELELSKEEEEAIKKAKL